MGKIYNISSSLPFFSSLAKGILERFEDIQNITIYLPNRRAQKTLEQCFLKQSGKNSLILPKIEAIGDVDEEDLYIRYFPDFEKIAPAIPPTERLYRIAKLINDRDDGNFVHALALSKSLIQLMDELHNKGLELNALENVVPEDFAAHWQVTLDFLKIISEDWQNYLRDNNLLEPIKRRNLLIEKLSAHYRDEGLKHPVIIAGTTGSIPSTVDLIKSIISDPKGYLVLDGLDRNLRDANFEILEETHPQYNLARLLHSLDTLPSNVVEWEEANLDARQKLISTALYPTELTPEWREFKNKNTAPHDIHLIEAANLEEEAMAIAIALRETLEDANKTAVVVTNNRQLSERIAAKMLIWDVEINNPMGQNLSTLATSRFLLELAEVMRSEQAPVELLSFFKHPFIPAEMKADIRRIEKEHLRGPRLENFDIANFGLNIPGFKDLEKMFTQESVLLSELLNKHIEVAENMITQNVLWRGDRGIRVYEHLRDVKASIGENDLIDPDMYPEILGQFISAAPAYRVPYNLHPQVNIFSPAEARMLSADKVIIAGMNEGSFPELVATDSFLSLEIRKRIGLDSPARKIGQAAHDFELLAQAPCVILTRSIKEQGSPSIKSRFLERLQAICDLQSGDKYCDWANQLNDPGVAIEAIKRPAPKPPLEARPKQLSATTVGRLMRDPYVVYSEKILRLEKLDDIDAEITADKFGIFIHRALELFAKNYDGKLETLIEIGQREFAELENKLGVKTFWWPKFLRIAEWFVENEQKARASNLKLYLEEKGERNIGGMNFTAKADRLEVGEEIKIVDYKTGNPPSNDMVDKGLDPQLAIEALIFSEKLGKNVRALEYWYLAGKEDEPVKPKPYKRSVEDMMDATEKGLNNLAATFLNENTPFIARPWSKYALQYNDYEHLARIKEWDE